MTKMKTIVPTMALLSQGIRMQAGIAIELQEAHADHLLNEGVAEELNAKVEKKLGKKSVEPAVVPPVVPATAPPKGADAENAPLGSEAAKDA